jgi:septal ring factor EnvC (AmiA/AmiB activator)
LLGDHVIEPAKRDVSGADDAIRDKRDLLDANRHVFYHRAMAQDPENLTLRMLRKMDEKLDRLLNEQADMKLRRSSLEQKTAIVITDIARIDTRLDGFETRLARIEKRLDLVEA